jgi:hypothetical protein
MNDNLNNLPVIPHNPAITDELRHQWRSKGGKTVTPAKTRASLRNLRKATEASRAKALDNRITQLRLQVAKAEHELAEFKNQAKIDYEKAIHDAVMQEKMDQATKKDIVLKMLLSLYEEFGGNKEALSIIKTSTRNKMEFLKKYLDVFPKLAALVENPEAERRTGGIQVHIHGFHREPITIKGRVNEEEQELTVEP